MQERQIGSFFYCSPSEPDWNWREESRDAEGSVKSASRAENFKELIPSASATAENIALVECSQENYRITRSQGFSLITSKQFMACFMTYISDIFGLGNSFRRMLHTARMLLFFYWRMSSYYESTIKLRNKGNSWRNSIGGNIFGGRGGRKLAGLIPCHTGQREYLFLMLQH